MTPRKNYAVGGVQVKGFKQYIALSLLSHGWPVPRDTLITHLWGEDDLYDPDCTLRALLSRLRLQLKPHGKTIVQNGRRGHRSMFVLVEENQEGKCQ